MSEATTAPVLRKFAREEPDPADPAYLAKLQQSAKLANENCDRAMALAHKLSVQLRDAQDRVVTLENDADGEMAQLRADTEAAVAKLQGDADAKVGRIRAEADERVAAAERAANERVAKIEAD